MKDSPQAPSPPDPQATAQAQMGLNADTARLQARLNRYNVSTPLYTQSWRQTGGMTPDYDAYNKALTAYNAQPATTASGGYYDGEAGQWIGQTQQPVNRGPAPTLDQFNKPNDQWETSYDLTPIGQQRFNQQQQIQNQLTGIASTAANRVQDTLGHEFIPNNLPSLQSSAGGGFGALGGGGNLDPKNLDSATIQMLQERERAQLSQGIRPDETVQWGLHGGPAPAGVGNGIATSFNSGGSIQKSLADAGQIQGQIPGTNDFSADRQRYEDALMSRLQPYLERDKEALINRTINSGNLQDSVGYGRAMDEFGRQANDARMQAILNAGTEQQRMFGMGLAGGQFANAAQGQRFGQGLASGQFANAGQAQQFGQNQALAGFGNQAQQQAYQQSLANAQLANQARQQGFGEQSYLRSLPLNETTALMSGSQVQMPNVQPTAGIGVQPVDYASLVNNQYMGQLGAYNTDVAQNNAMTSGLFQLGSAAVLGGMGGGMGGLFGGGLAAAGVPVVGAGAGMGGFGRGIRLY